MRRADTPVPRAAQPAGGLALPAGAEVSAAGPAAPAAPVRGYEAPRFDAVHKRKHTDVCCCIVFLAFTVGLIALALECGKIGDLKRLTNGFDFRGHLCGSDMGNASAAGEGDLLLWCSDDGEHRWTTPVCVKECPKGGESIFCPGKEASYVESESKEWDGSVTLSLVKKHRLKPVQAKPTYKFSKFCIPQNLRPSDVLSTDLQTFMAEFAGSLSTVQDASTLYTLLLITSVLFGLLWVHLLRTATLALAASVFWITSIACSSFGIQVLIAAVQTGAFSSAGDSKVSSAASATASAATSVLGVFTKLGYFERAIALELAVVQALGSFGANAQAAIGIVFIAVGVILLLYFAFARRTVSVAVDAMREACSVFTRLPTMVFLPLVQFVFHTLALILTAGGLVLLLSTAEVASSPGTSVVGLHRKFEWSGLLAGGVFGWVFAFLWYQELARALINFVLSWTAANWYFHKKLSWLPIASGLRIAVWFHLGSLALGAMVMAVVRLIVWMVRLLHKQIHDKEKANKCIKCLVGLLDCFMTMCEAIARRISDGAYTEIALSSENFCDASHAAVDLLLANAQLVATGAWLLRAVIMIASVIYSCLFGCGVYGLLTVPPKELGYIGKILPGAFVEQWDDLRNPAISALLASLVCFATVLSYQGVLDGTADAILYCYLWDKQDGVLDAENVPESFQKLISKSVASAHLKST